ncbi:hypothetical protein LFLT20_09920 [Limosilactobacillus fermentum]|uniref:Secreted protein n=1 Tax=Limosilactobacillus fermentum TaxID=1613 RepID=A0ABD0AIV5_LIMFE|nr:hypothetical protein ikematsu_16000 [Limosilactobacillus fermentum]GEA95804.1 hypothetical protein LFE01_02820 [Limosilactobacillus fermentum]GIC71298.1 hypothetical protein LF01B1_03130 [Limosilactobacillus fermentum]GIC73988.1 hypothetical protein LFLT20_09920 [Limosilactobacillus fermentum]
MELKTASTAAVASFLVRPVAVATLVTNSALFAMSLSPPTNDHSTGGDPVIVNFEWSKINETMTNLRIISKTRLA